MMKAEMATILRILLVTRLVHPKRVYFFKFSCIWILIRSSLVNYSFITGTQMAKNEFQFDILDPAHIQLNICTMHRNLRTLLQDYSSVHEATQQVYEDIENMKKVARILPPGLYFQKHWVYVFKFWHWGLIICLRKN